MVAESRDEMIRRLKDEIGKLLEDSLPHKGSKIDEIERITEEIGREVERKIEESVTRREGRGYVGSLAPCKCGGVGVYKKDYAKNWQTLHAQLVIPRAYYHCKSCGKGFAPLDEVLSSGSGSHESACSRQDSPCIRDSSVWSRCERAQGAMQCERIAKDFRASGGVGRQTY